MAGCSAIVVFQIAVSREGRQFFHGGTRPIFVPALCTVEKHEF